MQTSNIRPGVLKRIDHQILQGATHSSTQHHLSEGKGQRKTDSDFDLDARRKCTWICTSTGPVATIGNARTQSCDTLATCWLERMGGELNELQHTCAKDLQCRSHNSPGCVTRSNFLLDVWVMGLFFSQKNHFAMQTQVKVAM